ncbi:tetratricopeptide repeat protein [Candidatus Nitrosotenuis cloacae]|uniref:tetratricopeptide repeat protein n=1 Tax=Candidatus Nitrosotenuis cloacae TaxID=1603555 RepID=UPI00228044D7|nr:tetratricopeptide repeat protein [Candidatus Nitrosotenuis cloacae]
MPGNTEETYSNGITEFNLGNTKKALALFSQVLQEDPNHVGALIRQGNILGKLGRYNEAITSYDSALRIEPENALAQVNKGLALHYLERYDDAILCYDKILESKPSNSIALYNKASSLIRQNRIDVGFETLQKAIDVDFSCKYKARHDIDFEAVRKNNDFKRLVT